MMLVAEVICTHEPQKDMDWHQLCWPMHWRYLLRTKSRGRRLLHRASGWGKRRVTHRLSAAVGRVKATASGCALGRLHVCDVVCWRGMRGPCGVVEGGGRVLRGHARGLCAAALAQAACCHCGACAAVRAQAGPCTKEDAFIRDQHCVTKM